MICLRSLVWLLAMIAFIVPPFGAVAASHATATAPTEQAASADCPGHAPPPEDCPAEGTAKHAAGQCCPLMSGTVAMLPPAPVVDRTVSFAAGTTAVVQNLTGLAFTKDPPPPRV